MGNADSVPVPPSPDLSGEGAVDFALEELVKALGLGQKQCPPDAYTAREIARAAGCSLTSVRRAVREARERGLLEEFLKEVRRSDGKPVRVKAYRMKRVGDEEKERCAD